MPDTEAAGLSSAFDVPEGFHERSKLRLVYLGLQYMYRAGYDPQAFVAAFFEKVQALEKKKPGTLSKAFATHPQTPDRIFEITGRDCYHPSRQSGIHGQHLGI